MEDHHYGYITQWRTKRLCSTLRMQSFSKVFQWLEVQILCTSNQKPKPDVNLELLELCTPQVAREPLLEDEFLHQFHKFNLIDLTLPTACRVIANFPCIHACDLASLWWDLIPASKSFLIDKMAVECQLQKL